MTTWPLFLRLLATAIAIGLTVVAFSEGAMVLAVIGIAVTVFVVQRSFLTQI